LLTETGPLDCRLSGAGGPGKNFFRSVTRFTLDLLEKPRKCEMRNVCRKPARRRKP
jgi:hypothetical protein